MDFVCTMLELDFILESLPHFVDIHKHSSEHGMRYIEILLIIVRELLIVFLVFCCRLYLVGWCYLHLCFSSSLDIFTSSKCITFKLKSVNFIWHLQELKG